MIEPGFVEALKETLERSLGFGLKPLERLDGNTTLNFKATRISDGLVFAVKCSPPRKHAAFAALKRHYEALKGAKTAQIVFAEAPAAFRDYDLLCLSWCEGERLFPDRLTEEQASALVADYLVLSEALQRTVPAVRPVDFAEMRRQALARCCGFWAGGVRRLIENELSEARLALRPELTKVIHGDLHHGNFLFRGGRVSGFFDFECVMEGYPAEDFIRYFVCAAEHLRWYNQYRKPRILRLFRTVVDSAPYSCEEWTVAIDRLLADKVCRKVIDYGCGPGMALNLLFRARYYRALRQVAAEVRGRK